MMSDLSRHSTHNGALKLLMITHGFPPVSHSGTFRSEAFFRYLPEFGFDVAVICASDVMKAVLHYSNEKEPGNNDRICRVDWGLYSREPSHFLRNLFLRIPVTSTAVCRSKRSRLVRKVATASGYFINNFQPDVIYSSSPPVESHLISLFLGDMLKIPVVCDLRDPWSYNPFVRYRQKLDFLFEKNLEKRMLGKAARVIANTPTVKDHLINIIGIPEEKISLLTNGFHEDEFSAIKKEEMKNKRFTILYTGLIESCTDKEQGIKETVKRILGLDYHPLHVDSKTRSPKYILDAIRQILDDNTELVERIKMQFVGSFSKSNQALFRQFKYSTNLEVIDSVTLTESLRLCTEADLLLLLQIEMKKGKEDYCLAVPGKLYNYLRSGTRILAAMQESDSTRLIRDFNAGTVVPARDVSAIKTALKNNIDAWSKDENITTTGRDLSSLEWRNITRELADILEGFR